MYYSVHYISINTHTQSHRRTVQWWIHTHTHSHDPRDKWSFYHSFALLLCGMGMLWSPPSLSNPEWNAPANDRRAQHEACPCQQSHVYYFNYAYSEDIWRGKGQSIKTQSLRMSSIRKLCGFSWWGEERWRQETGPWARWLCYLNLCDAWILILSDQFGVTFICGNKSTKKQVLPVGFDLNKQIGNFRSLPFSWSLLLLNRVYGRCNYHHDSSAPELISKMSNPDHNWPSSLN